MSLFKAPKPRTRSRHARRRRPSKFELNRWHPPAPEKDDWDSFIDLRPNNRSKKPAKAPEFRRGLDRLGLGFPDEVGVLGAPTDGGFLKTHALQIVVATAAFLLAVGSLPAVQMSQTTARINTAFSVPLVALIATIVAAISLALPIYSWLRYRAVLAAVSEPDPLAGPSETAVASLPFDAAQ